VVSALQKLVAGLKYLKEQFLIVLLNPKLQQRSKEDRLSSVPLFEKHSFYTQPEMLSSVENAENRSHKSLGLTYVEGSWSRPLKRRCIIAVL
jgi:hypothetical protein